MHADVFALFYFKDREKHMKIIEAINRINSLKPNQYGVETKITWLSYLDGEIRRTVIDTHEGRPTTAFSNYTENDTDKELVVPAPFDEMYVTYLGMKIDEANCEATRYNNSAMMFNTQMQNFRIDYNRTHMPIQQGFRCRRPIPHDIPCDGEIPLSPPPVPSIPIAGESFGMIKVDPQDEYLSMDNGGFLRVDAEKIKEETLAEVPEGGGSGGGSGDGYTKAETDALLEDKADKILTYTKQEVDALIPSVPIKGIKANGESLTPDASGVVDIDTKDLLICTIRKQGDDWTIDKEAPDIEEAFTEGKLVVADIYDNYTFTRVPFNGYAFVRISGDSSNTVVEWWEIITETMVDPFTGEETYDGTGIYYVTQTIPQSSGATIDDSSASASKVYSSQKTEQLVSGCEKTVNRLGTVNPSTDLNKTSNYYSAAGIVNYFDKVVPHYISARSWAVGDYCSFNGTIYRCTTAHSNVQWTAGYWTAVASLAEDISDRIDSIPSGGGGSADVVIRCTADYDIDWEYPFRLILPNGMTYADIKDKIITFEVPIDGSIKVTGTEVHIWTGSYYIDDDIYLCLSPYSGASYDGILFGEGELASFLITEYNGQIYGIATNMSAKRYYMNIDERINAKITELDGSGVAY